MSELNIDGQSTGPLAKMLEDVSKLQKEKAEAEAALKVLNKQLKALEQLAVELLAASGLDGVKVAGKSWRLREFFGVSVPAENRTKVVEAAKAEGLDNFVTVNTSTLKSWLIERKKESESSNGHATLATGTAFDGLVSEYRETRLAHISVNS